MGSKNNVASKNNCSTLWDICHMCKNYKDRWWENKFKSKSKTWNKRIKTKTQRLKSKTWNVQDQNTKRSLFHHKLPISWNFNMCENCKTICACKIRGPQNVKMAWKIYIVCIYII